MQDLAQAMPFKLIHGHLGDPLGRAGTVLDLGHTSVQQVFSDHDGEMLIVCPGVEDPSTREWQ